jgi:hypothetical protein
VTLLAVAEEEDVGLFDVQIAAQAVTCGDQVVSQGAQFVWLLHGAQLDDLT